MKFRWQRGWGGNRGSLPYLVFILSLAATVCAWVWAGLIVGTQDNDRFRSATEEAELAIKGRIDDQEDLVRASAATYALQGGWTRAQFHSYVDNLSVSASYQGSQGLGFIRRTHVRDLKSLEAKIRAEGESEFTVHPKQAGPELYPIVYLEPESILNAPSIGFDAASDPVRREAMFSARDLGLPTISGVIAWEPTRPGGRPQTSFVLYCPIFQGGDVPDAATDRKNLLIGFVFSRFRGADIFRDVLEGEARKDLDIEIFDVHADAEPVRFYSSSRTRTSRESRISVDGYIPVAGRQWMIRYHSSPGFEEQSAGWLVSWIPIVGFLVSTLLATVSFSQVRAYRQLDNQAARLVRREAQQRLLANIGATFVDSGATEQNIRAICRLVAEEFADWFGVCLKERPDSQMTVAYDQSLLSRSRPSLEAALNDGFLRRIFSVVEPTTMDLAGSNDPDFQVLKDAHIHSVAIVPIMDRLGFAGAIVAGRIGLRFDEDEIRVLEEIASRTAMAADSIRLFREKERELEERRKAEALVRRLNENLEHIVQERTTELRATNQELEAFCYSVSHDLRAPLRSVDGFSKSLLEDYGEQLDDQARDYIGRVRSASHRMDELISALLNLSRITRLEIVRHPIDISQLAHVASEDALEGKDRDHYVVTVQAGMVAEADPKLIRVLLDNLVRNAIKFSAPSETSKIDIGQDKKGFFVRDNGVGFNPAYADKLFVAFERLHTQNEFPGSGIGLATVQRIVQKHGGAVWAESEEGKGATFYFTLR
jgi:signal transduction histidine kinase/CHASE1-domain containing sensor protein